MDIPENNNKKIILVAILILIIILIVVAVVWKNKTKKAAQTQTQTTTGATTGLPTDIPAPPEMPKIPVLAEVTSISGTVEKIEGKILTVKALFFGEEKTFSVTAGDATKIQKSEMKKEIPKPEEGKPLELFILTDASFSDIRQNDKLTVEANENIKDKTSFEAKTININITNLSDIPAPPDMPKIENLPAPPDMPALPAPPSMPNIPKS